MGRDLIVKRVPEYGWACFDRLTREKVLPDAPNAWFRTRHRAIRAKDQYLPPAPVFVAGNGVGVPVPDLLDRAVAAEREVHRYKGLLDEAKGYIAALEEELRAVHDDGPDCLCIGDE